MKKLWGNSSRWQYALLALLAVSVAGCGGSSSSSSGPPTFELLARGGSGGITGSGGDGDSVYLYKEGGFNTVEISRTGRANASYSATNLGNKGFLGNNPLIIDTDTTLDVVEAAGDKPASGMPYLTVSAENHYIHISDGNNGAFSPDERVTGLRVNSGRVLTLELNRDAFGSGTFDQARIRTAGGDVVNHGTITTVDVNADQRGSFRIGSTTSDGSYLATGKVETHGVLSGQDGGEVYIRMSHSVLNNGAITAHGADSENDGGHGGRIYLRGNYWVENNAVLDSSGGDSEDGYGGNAGSIDMYAYGGSARNSGNLFANGGQGTDGGGHGNEIEVYSEEGDLFNRGNLQASGGNTTGGNAGDGGSLYFEAEGGSVLSRGSITMRGGHSSSPTGNGGRGGDLYFENDYDGLYEYTPPGDILVSGNIDISGGNALASGSGNGGRAGEVDIDLDNRDYPLEQRAALLGYRLVDISGGDGGNGGDAGNRISLYNDEGDSDLGFDTSSGNVINSARIVARGGNVLEGAVSGRGGDGGNVNLETEYRYGMFNPDGARTINSGELDLRSGDSLDATGHSDAGNVWMWGYNGVTNSGMIRTSGGPDAGSDGGIDGYGGRGDYVELYAELGPVRNSASITTRGGDGEYRGGRGGSVDLLGPEVRNSGAINTGGGNADPSLAASAGGNARDVELFAPHLSLVSNSASITAQGGAGTTPGDNGEVLVGGLCQSGC